MALSSTPARGRPYFVPVALLMMLAAGAALAQVPAAPVTGVPGDDGFAWRTLSSLCDLVGSRPAGSPQMRKAAEWAVATFKEAGFDSVWTEPVTVPVELEITRAPASTPVLPWKLSPVAVTVLSSIRSAPAPLVVVLPRKRTLVSVAVEEVITEGEVLVLSWTTMSASVPASWRSSGAPPAVQVSPSMSITAEETQLPPAVICRSPSASAGPVIPSPPA